MNLRNLTLPAFLLVTVVTQIAFAPVSAAQVGVLPVKEWRGELFKQNEGALYFHTRFAGFRGGISSNLVVTYYNIIQQKNVIVNQAQSPVGAFPREMWRVPSGKYRIDRVELVDAGGTKRVWESSQTSPVLVLVPRNSLANVGLWTITPDGPSGIKVLFAPYKNTYSEEGPKKESSIAVVVNGFTGIIQEVFGGKKVIEGAAGNYSENGQLRAVSTITRQISMFFKLDLFQDNASNKEVIQAINGFDANLRGCYSHALTANASLRGNIILKVLISDRTGTMRQIKRSGGSLTDGGVTDCLIGELAQIPLPVHKSMIGELTFLFDMSQR